MFKQTFAALAVVSILAASCDVAKDSAQSVALTNQSDSISYALGLDIATNLKKSGAELNVDAIAQGMRDFMDEEKEPICSPAESDKLMQAFQVKLQQEQQAKQAAEMANRDAKGAENQRIADEFLATNKTKEGVITLESGLQYTIMKQGDGPMPTPADKVTTHYHGTLLDGTVFDSSVDRGKPSSFGVMQVIKAWQEILPMMKQGSKYKIFCPPNLAYGPRGSGAKIGPNTALIFEIELIGIN